MCSPQNGEAVDHSVKRNRSTSDGKDSEGQPVVVKRHKKRKVEKVNDIEAKSESVALQEMNTLDVYTCLCTVY